MKQALLAVSFGTSVSRAGESIDAVENALRKQAPHLPFYRAFTSPTIRRILAARGQAVPGLEEALERMRSDGASHVILQPTHLLYGYEYDKLKATAEVCAQGFEKFQTGSPLLAGTQDLLELARVLDAVYPAVPEQEYVFLGHGTEHFANMVYPALETVLHTLGRVDCFVTTVEGWPDYETTAEKMRTMRAHLVPLMLVAGEHALNDMAGEHSSLKAVLEAQGKAVECTMTGLGLLAGVQEMYCRHLRQML